MSENETTYTIEEDTGVAMYGRGPAVVGVELSEDGEDTLNIEFRSPAELFKLRDAIDKATEQRLALCTVALKEVHSLLGPDEFNALIKRAYDKLLELDET